MVALLGFLDDEPEVTRRLILSAASRDSVSLEHRQRLFAVLADLLDETGLPGSPTSRPSSTLTTELVVGGVFSVIHARAVNLADARPLVELAPSLMAFIVTPFLGPMSARSELTGTPAPADAPVERRGPSVRATYRTTLVLRAIAAAPGSSNREIAEAAGLRDEGQASKLLSRLEQRGAIVNTGLGAAYGEPNSWLLTTHGESIARSTERGATPAVRRRSTSSSSQGRLHEL